LLEQLESRCVLAAPDAPFGLLPTSGNEQVALSWTAPVNDGGFTITDYLVQWRETAAAPDAWTLHDDGISANPNAVVDGLMNGTSYVFRVAAVNADVDVPEGGPFSSNSPASTPAGLPAAPTDLVAEAGDSSVALTWTVPDGNGAAITSYVVEITNSDSEEVTTQSFVASSTGDTQTVTVSELVNGTPYVFRVAAVNGAIVDGQTQGEYSDQTTPPVTPSALPATPAVTSATATGTEGESGIVELVWTDLQSSDQTIASYVVQYRAAGEDWQPLNADIIVNTYTFETADGLIDGVAYTFRVAAKTIYGRQGEFSAESEAVTPSPLPGPATDVVAEAIDSEATVTWTEADGFGVAIASYVLELSTDGGETWLEYVTDAPITGSPAVLENLTNGQSYVFRVAAVNDFGRQGAFSDPSEAVTPLGAPDAPAGFSAQSSDRSVKLTWSDPADTGGLPVSGYTVEYRRVDFVRGVAVPGNWIVVTKEPTRTGTNLSLTLTGLVNGARYEFNAVTKTGTEEVQFESEEASSAAMPLAAVTGVVARAATGVAGAPASVAVGWIPPRLPAGVAVTDYVIQYSSDAGKTWQTYEDGVSRANVTRLSLVNGNTYVFKVAAVTTLRGSDSLQQSDFSVTSAPVTPFVRTVVAASPTGLAGESVRGGVRLSWTAPAVNQGGAAVRYVVQYRLDVPNARWMQTTVPASALNSAVIGRLGAGKSYSFRIAAVNMAGQSAWSDVLSGVLA
jgi:titin